MTPEQEKQIRSEFAIPGSYVDLLLNEIDRLRALLNEAPHGNECHGNDRLSEPCDYWKAKIQEAL